MSREEALKKIRTGWACWKPGEAVTKKDGSCHRESIFTGVAITCTQKEWEEIVTALSA